MNRYKTIESLNTVAELFRALVEFESVDSQGVRYSLSKDGVKSIAKVGLGHVEKVLREGQL